MTKREFYTAIAENESLTADLRSMATDLLSKLDSSNEKRQNTAAAKKAKENAPIVTGIYNLLTEKGAMVSSDIATALGLTTAKVGAMCKKMVEGGMLTATDEKVKGGRSVKKWAVAPTETADNESAEDVGYYQLGYSQLKTI